MAAENWLNEENFDFDLNLSRSSVEEGVLNTTEEDDEVFFGAVTHKEKCMAVIVQEKEAMRSVERLNPDQQAALLREAALINLRIKDRSTPGQPRKMSPVAVVRPMQSGMEEVAPCALNENKENRVPCAKINVESKEEVVLADIVDPLASTQTSSPSQVTAPSLKLMKKAASQPSLQKNRLSMPVRPLSSRGPQKSLVFDSQNNNNNQEAKDVPADNASSAKTEPQKNRRFSSIPKQGSAPKSAGGIPKSKSDASMPSLPNPVVGLNSKLGKPGGGVPKPRLKSKQFSQSGNSKLLPSKLGTAQSDLKLSKKPASTTSDSKSVTKKAISVSTDTPSTAAKKMQMPSSQKRKSLAAGSGISTPMRNSLAKAPLERGGGTATKQARGSVHSTPVTKSSRRSIIGRQLNGDINVTSRSPSPVERRQIVCEMNGGTNKVAKKRGEECLDDVKPPLAMDEDASPAQELSLKTIPAHNVPETEKDETCQLSVKPKDNTTTNPVNNDNCAIVNSEQQQEQQPHKHNQQPEQLQHQQQQQQQQQQEQLQQPLVLPPTQEQPQQSQHGHEQKQQRPEQQPEQRPEQQPEQQPEVLLLLDFGVDEETKEVVSPPKFNQTDPFETGHTPPPLIDLGEILEPVREEVNLIEF